MKNSIYVQKSFNNINLNYLLEFALGYISENEMLNILKKDLSTPTLKKELDIIEKSLENFVRISAKSSPKNLKLKILNTITEILSLPPILKPTSKIEDYRIWLNEVKKPDDFDNIHMEIIGDYENTKMIIAWIKEGEPDHDHYGYSENFLIIEGQCTATIDGITADYNIGDYVHFPINKKHGYSITSNIPMKVVACLDLKAA